MTTGLKMPREQALEEARLQNAEEIMYGNKDTEKIFPFDVRMRNKYLVYHEVLQATEDGQILPKLTTRKFSFYSVAQWKKMHPANRKSFFERQKMNIVILHDPIEQARLENKRLDNEYESRTGLSLAEKLANAKTATQVSEENKAQEGQSESLTSPAPITKKRSATRKEVKNG